MSWFSSAVKRVQNTYSGSDLETVVNTVTNPTGTDPLTPAMDAMEDAVANIVPVQTGPSLAATQPTIGAGQQVPIEQNQIVPGMMQRGTAPGRMGRRQTMLTVGQSAAKIRARQTGY